MDQTILVAIFSGIGVSAYIIATVNSIKIDRLKARVEKLERKSK